AARPAGPPPDRAEPEPGSGQPHDRGPGPGTRAPGQYPGPAAADRRARGGEPAARRQWRHRPGHGPAPAGRPRALAGRGPGHPGAAGDRRPGAGARGPALHPGDHHQRGAPCLRRQSPPYTCVARGRGDPPGGPGQWRGRRRRRPRQRPARHARAGPAVRRDPRHPDPEGRRLRPAPVHPSISPGAAGYRRSVAMIRVCLVDDQTLVRQGIKSLLALDGSIEVVAEAGDGRQAVEMIPQVAPDVVLMDMRMPVMSGLEALQTLSQAGQLPPTIILTTFDDDQLVLAGLKAGARGYLLKDVSLEQLVGAIQTVASGGSLVQPAVTQRLLSGLEHMRNDFVSLDRPD